MKLQANNLAFRYALIACFSIALLFSQTFKAHMHLQHAENFAETSQQHITDVHVDIGSSLHDSPHNSHHQDDFIDHNFHAEIDVSTDSFVKKVESLNSFLLLFIIVGFTLLTPRLQNICKRYTLKIKPVSLHYLFLPPLRAPPK